MILGMPVRQGSERVKVGRRYVRQPVYFFDAQRLAVAGFLTNLSPGAPLTVGASVTITTAPHHSLTNLGNWTIVEFRMGCAQIQKNED
jgi:hypothetical protein